MTKRRNPVVRHAAILRKGGAHTITVSGKRHQSKRQLDDEIDDYFDQREESQPVTTKEQDDSAPSFIPKSLLKNFSLPIQLSESSTC